MNFRIAIDTAEAPTFVGFLGVQLIPLAQPPHGGCSFELGLTADIAQDACGLSVLSEAPVLDCQLAKADSGRM